MDLQWRFRKVCSGPVAPPAVGMGFNEILNKHLIISGRIKHNILTNKLDTHSLNDIMLDYQESINYTFLRVVLKLYRYGNNIEGFRRGNAILKKNGHVFTRKWMRNE